MKIKRPDLGTRQDRHARFRFTVVGPLLSSPPESGGLRAALMALAQKPWIHPTRGEPTTFAFSTIERWLYDARSQDNPIVALRTKRRDDAGCSRQLSVEAKQIVKLHYSQHPSWSYQLHADNLAKVIENSSDLGEIPSYSTVLRYMKAQHFYPQSRIRKKDTAGALKAAERLESHEVRSYESDHVLALWHLDFHHGGRPILGRDGGWHKPMLLAILDDRSRLICHIQWYLDETAESLVHGFMQALQKRGLPRALLTDNGSAMISEEFTLGLERLGILHQTTLPYSPYQNGKGEVIWAQVEGRLMAMLEGVKELTLDELNKATLAWAEYEYHQKKHSEINATPLERYLEGPSVGRDCPGSVELRQAFTCQVARKQRRSDGTVSLDGKRFEVPSAYRHIENLTIRYARWDYAHVMLMDPHSKQILCSLYPQDKAANASGIRRTLAKPEASTTPLPVAESGMAPLLKDYVAQAQATGLPPAYIPQKKETSSHDQ